jgi:Ion channel
VAVKVIAGIAGLSLIALILWEAFETIVLPRRVARRIRLTRAFYRGTWIPWRALARVALAGTRREGFLGVYGPLSLLGLLMFWAAGLVAGFALLYWALGSAMRGADGASGFATDLYVSGTTFFTLGLGDVTPHTHVGRTVVVIEGGMGFAFLALMISYLPVLYQSFSRREVGISLLDARAGSPPTAGELLRRHVDDSGQEALRELLERWERWAAELLESHLSYPALAYFRSQHNNQSWLSALTAILDASALLMVVADGRSRLQARLTFAMARHAVGDLAHVFNTPPDRSRADRLPATDLARLRAFLTTAGLKLQETGTADRELALLRGLYEPYVIALARYLEMTVPAWFPDDPRPDNWQTTAWEPRPASIMPSVARPATGIAPPGEDRTGLPG